MEQDRGPRGVLPQAMPCPQYPEHSQSGRCSPRWLFCQDAAVIRKLEDAGGPCASCGVGRARRQLRDRAHQALWAEEGKDKGESGEAWINPSVFPIAEESSSSGLPPPQAPSGPPSEGGIQKRCSCSKAP